MLTKMFMLKVLWICMSISVVFSEGEESQSMDSMLKSALFNCETETKIDLDELTSLSISQPLSHDQSCYVNCVMSKFDLIHDNKFSVNKTNTYIDKFMKHGENSEKTDMKKKIVERCADKYKDETDSCVLSGAMFQCMGRELPNAGFTTEDSSHKISKRSKQLETDEESKEEEKEQSQRNINFVAFSYYNFLLKLLFQSLGNNK